MICQTIDVRIPAMSVAAAVLTSSKPAASDELIRNSFAIPQTNGQDISIGACVESKGGMFQNRNYISPTLSQRSHADGIPTSRVTSREGSGADLREKSAIVGTIPKSKIFGG
jgi:hypothetical protein